MKNKTIIIFVVSLFLTYGIGTYIYFYHKEKVENAYLKGKKDQISATWAQDYEMNYYHGCAGCWDWNISFINKKKRFNRFFFTYNF